MKYTEYIIKDCLVKTEYSNHGTFIWKNKEHKSKSI